MSATTLQYTRSDGHARSGDDYCHILLGRDESFAGPLGSLLDDTVSIVND